MRMIRNLDTNIAEFKTQLFEEIKEKTCMKSDKQLTEFEFPCDEKKLVVWKRGKGMAQIIEYTIVVNNPNSLQQSMYILPSSLVWCCIIVDGVKFEE